LIFSAAPTAGADGTRAALVKAAMQTPRRDDPTLHTWLDTIHGFITQRRHERIALPKPKRNRERERARREARQLFREFYAEQASLQ
jgi:hypothetical protein